MQTNHKKAAIISVFGTLHNLPERLWDATSYRFIAQAIKDAEKGSAEEIILDFDSPGGDLNGLDTVVNTIKTCTKPIIAYITGSCCSAAYYLASQCTKIIASGPNASIGSIGVIFQSLNEREFLKSYGINLFELVSKESPDKVPESQEHFEKVYREKIEEHYRNFIAAVAAGRKVSEDIVRTKFGRGATLTARQALEVGMIDAIESDFEQENLEEKEDKAMNEEELAAALLEDPEKGTKAIIKAFEENKDIAMACKAWLDSNLQAESEIGQKTQKEETKEDMPEAAQAARATVAMAMQEKFNKEQEQEQEQDNITPTPMPTTFANSDFEKFKLAIKERNERMGFKGHGYL